MARLHKNKEISEALEYALARGFRLTHSNAHPFARLYCPLASPQGHIKSIWSTPTDPHGHARDIRRFVDSCEHWARPDRA